MQQKLNIPIELIKTHKSSKDDLEVLAFSIGIKLITGNSIYKVKSIREVMRNFQVSYKTASRVLENAKKSELFSYNENRDIFYSYTYKSKEIKYSSRGRKYISDYCYKFIIGEKEEIKHNQAKKEKEKRIETISLQKLVKELRTSLILNAIHVKQMRQLTLQDKNIDLGSTLVSLTQQHLANTCGYSRPTTNRIIKSMVDNKDKVLNKKGAEIVVLFNSISEGSINQFKESHPTVRFKIGKDCGIKVIPCSYGIATRTVENKFVHVIYDKKGRKPKKGSFSTISNNHWDN